MYWARPLCWTFVAAIAIALSGCGGETQEDIEREKSDTAARVPTKMKNIGPKNIKK